MKNYNIILTEKQHKYQHYSLVILKNMNILQVKNEEILPSNQSQIILQAKFTYSPLGKTLEKQRNFEVQLE